MCEEKRRTRSSVPLNELRTPALFWINCKTTMFFVVGLNSGFEKIVSRSDFLYQPSVFEEDSKCGVRERG